MRSLVVSLHGSFPGRVVAMSSCIENETPLGRKVYQRLAESTDGQLVITDKSSDCRKKHVINSFVAWRCDTANKRLKFSVN